MLDFPLNRLEENGKSVYNTFVAKFGKYHKTCRNKFDQHHLDRVLNQKNECADDFNTLNDQEQILGNDNDLNVSNESVRPTRSSFCSKNFQVVCFFCGKADQGSNLRQAMTVKLDQRVRQGASLLCDETLLAKLSEGDMVATEAKYHNTCLCSFYKKVKNNNKESNSASICHVMTRLCMVLFCQKQ